MYQRINIIYYPLKNLHGCVFFIATKFNNLTINVSRPKGCIISHFFTNFYFKYYAQSGKCLRINSAGSFQIDYRYFLNNNLSLDSQ